MGTTGIIPTQDRASYIAGKQGSPVIGNNTGAFNSTTGGKTPTIGGPVGGGKIEMPGTGGPVQNPSRDTGLVNSPVQNNNGAQTVNGLPHVNPLAVPSTNNPNNPNQNASIGNPAQGAVPTALTTPLGQPGPDPLNVSPVSQLDPKQQQQLQKQLVDIYGKGVGNLLFSQMATLGSNNSAYMKAYNAYMAPANAQGKANLNSTLGSSGVSMDSSTGAIANAMFETGIKSQEGMQVQQLLQSESQTAAGLTQGTQSDALSEVSDSGWTTLLGALETAGGVALEFVPGGQLAGAALIGGGIATMTGKSQGGGGGNRNNTSSGTANTAGGMISRIGTSNVQTTNPDTSNMGVIPLEPLQGVDVAGIDY